MKKTDKIKKIYKNIIFGVHLFKANLLKQRIPFFTYLLISNKCNLKCRYCFAEVDQKFDVMSTKEILALVDELWLMGTKAINVIGGEPLMHQDFSDIVSYIQKKGMLCETMTNGYFVREKIDALKKVHSVCMSLDGDRKLNDYNRGRGCYEKVIEALDLLYFNKINFRIHAVITKDSFSHIGYLIALAKKYKTFVTFANPAIDEKLSGFYMDDSQLRNFFKELYRRKKIGDPIGTSLKTLKYVIDWPLSYNKRMVRLQDVPDGFVPFKCKRKVLSCFIQADGTVYACPNLWKDGNINLKKTGFSKAWAELGNVDCLACGNSSENELSLALSLSPCVLWEILGYVLSSRT